MVLACFVGFPPLYCQEMAIESDIVNLWNSLQQDIMEESISLNHKKKKKKDLMFVGIRIAPAVTLTG